MYVGSLELSVNYCVTNKLVDVDTCEKIYALLTAKIFKKSCLFFIRMVYIMILLFWYKMILKNLNIPGTKMFQIQILSVISFFYLPGTIFHYPSISKCHFNRWTAQNGRFGTQLSGLQGIM